MKRDALQTFWNHAGIELDPAKLGNPSQISWRSCSRFDFRFFILSLFGVISPARQVSGLNTQDKI
jgi:hypothetical protein